MDFGIIDLGSSVFLTVQCVSDARAPTAPDATPTYRIYGPASTLMTNGSGSFEATVIDSQTGFYGVLVACTAQNGYQAGVTYTVQVSYAISSASKTELHTFMVS